MDIFSDFVKSEKKVLVGGCFDIFHFGHLTFLEKAKKQGDLLIVALESDEFINKIKKRIPVHNQLQRARILAGMQIVNYVLCLPFFRSNKDYFNLVNILKPKIIAVTENDRNFKIKQTQAKLIKAKVKVVTPNIVPFASSKIHSYESFFRD